jgi:lipopolysaccharide export system protein LptA
MNGVTLSFRIATLITAALIAAPAMAQTVTNAFNGISGSSKEPINIESNVLVVHDKDKYATFTGNVTAVQGTTTLHSRELIVHYIGGDQLTGGSDASAPPKAGAATAAAAPTAASPTAAATAASPTAASPTKVADAQGGAQPANGGTQITKIEAKGDVVITSTDKDQTTTSEWALYDVPAQLITVGGNVVLTQGENVLKGDRLVIDLKTNESRFDNPGDATNGGRIRALFMPKGNDQSDAKPSDTKSGDTKPADTKSADTKPADTKSAAAKKETASGSKPDATGWTAETDNASSSGAPMAITPGTKP